MPKKSALRAPLIDDLILPDLASGYASDLVTGASFEATRFEGTDLSGMDLSDITFSECELIDVSALETQLRGVRFVESKIQRLGASSLKAPGAVFRDVEISDSRIGAGEWYDSEITSVRITGSKLGWFNLRACDIRDVHLVNCTIDDLDLGEARVDRLAFTGCSVNMLHLNGAQLRHVDLRDLQINGIDALDGMRGATISSDQALHFANAFAGHLGIDVR